MQVLAKMRNLKLLPNIRTYELLFSLFGNVNALYEKGNMLSHLDVAKRINTRNKWCPAQSFINEELGNLAYMFK